VIADLSLFTVCVSCHIGKEIVDLSLDRTVYTSKCTTSRMENPQYFCEPGSMFAYDLCFLMQSARR
jgi:hypothetical protein